MTLLLPIGLLALLSIVALIIIYIIKANYQQKYVSSTYIWALSLKLRKKRLPINKLRNILLIVCQVLFLTVCGLALAYPAKITQAMVTEREVIAVIDSSASMLAGDGGETRFERAVNRVSALAEEVFNEDGYVSVILAGETSSVIAQRATAESRNLVLDELARLLSENSCSYGTADMAAAMGQCENIIRENKNAELYLYTDTEYTYLPGGIRLVDVAEDNEWNAGILDAYTVVEDNYYSVFVEVACYGMDREVAVTVQVQDVNAEENEGEVGKTVTLRANVACKGDQTMTVIFRSDSVPMEDYESNSENVVYVPIENDQRFYSYGSINITIEGEDSFSQDDAFAIYDGKKEVIKVQYCSPLPNNFADGVLRAIANYYSTKKNIWDVQITEVHSDPAVEGFDLYVFEHTMPSVMPQDGIVWLWDLDRAPEGSGLTLGGINDYSSNNEGIHLTQESDSPLLTNVSAGALTVSRFTQLLSYDPSYQVLLSCDTSPVLLVKNDGMSKVVVMPFSVHYSNIGIKPEYFVPLVFNLFETWIPATVIGNAFSVYEEVSLNARGQQLTVTSTSLNNESIVFTQFPAVLSLDLPGTYTLTQTTDFGKTVEERIYVKIPAYESNIWSVEDTIHDPFLIQEGQAYEDLTLYLAAALVALLFCEWLLHSRELF